jgi:hypothetical protein
MKLTDSQINELRYVRGHGKPIWGGVLARGGADRHNREMQFYLDNDLIRSEGAEGYILTERAIKIISEPKR